MFPAAADEVVLKNTFLCVESKVESTTNSQVARRARSSDSSLHRRTCAPSGVTQMSESLAIQEQIHRLNHLRHLDLKCLKQQFCCSAQPTVAEELFEPSNRLARPAKKRSSSPRRAGAVSQDLAGNTRVRKENATNSQKPHFKSDTGNLPTSVSKTAASDRCRQCNISDEYRTAMIRNIPYDYTQDQLVVELATLGLEPTCYDALYMPRCRRKNSNLGYAFIDFKETRWVRVLKTALRKHRFKDLQGKCFRPPHVSAAFCQAAGNNLTSLLHQTCHSESAPCGGARSTTLCSSLLHQTCHASNFVRS